MPPSGWDPFARCTAAQREQLSDFRDLLLDINSKINLISRDTEPFFDERHLLHSLTLSVRTFPSGSIVVDWGTGGGLPAVPLAICFPEVTFHAVDAVGKKVQAVRTFVRRLGLKNLEAWHTRAEAWPGRAHYSVSRATAPLTDLWRWHERVCLPEGPPHDPAAWPPGLLCLKGGDLQEETAALQHRFPGVRVEQEPLEPLLARAYFADKYLVSVREIEQERP